MKRSLRNLRILNTRPKEQAHTLSQCIRDAGGLVIECPTLDIQATNNNWLALMPDLQQIDFAIFISPNAVRFCFQELQKKNILWPRHIRVIALGQETASTLKAFGVTVKDIPETPDSEHVLRLASLQTPIHQTVLLFKGVGGRKTIEEGLQKRGANVFNLLVYKRAMPKIHKQLLESIWQGDVVDIILITSEESMNNLFKLFGANAHSWLQGKICIVLSERLAKAAALLGMKKIIISRPDKIMNTLLDYSEGLIHGQ